MKLIAAYFKGLIIGLGIIVIAYFYFFWLVELFNKYSGPAFFWLWFCGVAFIQATSDVYSGKTRKQRMIETIIVVLFWPFVTTWTFITLAWKNLQLRLIQSRRGPPRERPDPPNIDAE